MMKTFAQVLLCVYGGACMATTVPLPLPERPGNVCTEKDEVRVVLPAGFDKAVSWEARDLDGKNVVRGAYKAGMTHVELGRQPVGWYRIEGLDGAGKPVAWTTAAVLKRLAVPVPSDSPIRIDTANAWFTRTGEPERDRRKMAAFASLAALAGVSGVRDRLTWGDLEHAPGEFHAATRYDDSARILRGAGLEVLQVYHSTPSWAQMPRLEEGKPYKRFPRDLRDSFRFCRAMAERFKGVIQAWEPWNEANIPGFGGHLIDEMVALQKASYLGFKAGDPSLTVCWNVYAGSGSALHVEGVIEGGPGRITTPTTTTPTAASKSTRANSRPPVRARAGVRSGSASAGFMCGGTVSTAICRKRKKCVRRALCRSRSRQVFLRACRSTTFSSSVTTVKDRYSLDC